jgi:hypothetical protein
MRMPLPILMAVTTRIGLGSIMLLLAACAAPPATHVLTGTARPPISPDEVRIYSQPPPVFEEVAMLTASSDSRLGSSAGGQAAIDVAIDRLKTEAAKFGANGVILQGISDRQTGSIGTGVGNESYSSHSAVGVGVVVRYLQEERAGPGDLRAQGFPLIPTAPLRPPPVPAPGPGSQVPPSGQ